MLFVKLDDIIGNGEKFFIRREVSEPGGIHISLHRHDHFEIMWVEEGKGHHVVNGKTVAVERGTIAFIRPEDEHKVTPVDGVGVTVCSLSFFPATATYFRRRYFLHSRKYFWSKEKIPFHDSLDDDLLDWLSVKFQALFHKPRTNFFLDQFLLSLFEVLGQSNPWLNEKDIPGWLINALSQYKTPRHFAQGAEGFAALANRSVEHVSRTTKKHLDMTLSEVINRERMHYAARQLVITDDPIFSIAMDCNFSHLSYFYSLFKEHYQLTPGEYRELNRRFS